MFKLAADQSGALVMCQARGRLDFTRDQGGLWQQCFLCFLNKVLHHFMSMMIHADTTDRIFTRSSFEMPHGNDWLCNFELCFRRATAFLGLESTG